MDSFKLYIDGKEITDGETLSLDKTQTKPKYKFKAKKDDLHTIVMVDPDAPYPGDAKYKYWLHWIVINNTETLVPFNPPSPPEDSKPHRYFFFLFKQKGRLEPKNMTVPKERKNFSLTDFENKYNLDDVANIYFKTGHKIDAKLEQPQQKPEQKKSEPTKKPEEKKAEQMVQKSEQNDTKQKNDNKTDQKAGSKQRNENKYSRDR